MANILFLGGVSGGHFNPAVSLAVYVREWQKSPDKRFRNALQLVMMWISQIIGASIGVWLVYLLNGKDLDQ